MAKKKTGAQPMKGGRDLSKPLCTEKDLQDFKERLNKGIKEAEDSGKFQLGFGSKRLIEGVIRVFITVWVFGTYGASWGYDFDKVATPFFQNYFSKELSDFLVALIATVLYIALIVNFVKGVYKIRYWNMYIPLFEDKSSGVAIESSSSGRYSNIEEALRYRDSKMSMMDNDSRLKFYKETSRLNLEMMDHKTKDYLNSKMAFKDNDTKLDMLRGK
jgi:hypothetical protein